MFINSAPLSKIRRAAGTCHSVLSKSGVVQRWPWTVSTDAVQLVNLFQVSGPETAKFLRPMAVAVRCTSSLPEAADAQVLTSCEMNDRPAELSEIRGCRHCVRLLCSICIY